MCKAEQLALLCLLTTMSAGKLRKTITLLTIPTIMFLLVQLYAWGLIVWTWWDSRPISWPGFNGFGVAAAAFMCSLPALAALARSDIQGSLRYLLIAVHTLWFMIGGLYVLFAIPPWFLWW
jgi:hypothetical protein